MLDYSGHHPAGDFPFAAPRPTDPAERAHAHHPAWQQPASLFFADEDYRCYLGWLKAYAGKTGCRIDAYGWMTNPVHLLVSAQARHGTGTLMKALGQR